MSNLRSTLAQLCTRRSETQIHKTYPDSKVDFDTSSNTAKSISRVVEHQPSSITIGILEVLVFLAPRNSLDRRCNIEASQVLDKLVSCNKSDPDQMNQDLSTVVEVVMSFLISIIII